MEQTIRLPEVQELCGEVLALINQIEDLRQKVLPVKLWYSRAELAALKGMPVSTFYNKPWLLPPGGPQKQGGTDRWSWKQVWDSGWIWKSDANLNPRGGEDGEGTATGSQSRTPGTPAPMRRVRGFRRGEVRTRQPG